jgi:hypothetical protein
MSKVESTESDSNPVRATVTSALLLPPQKKDPPSQKTNKQ